MRAKEHLDTPRHAGEHAYSGTSTENPGQGRRDREDKSRDAGTKGEGIGKGAPRHPGGRLLACLSAIPSAIVRGCFTMLHAGLHKLSGQIQARSSNYSSVCRPLYFCLIVTGWASFSEQEA
jgi:hypothetical protein